MPIFKKTQFLKAETYYKKAIKKNPTMRMPMPITILPGSTTPDLKILTKEKGWL
jgi:hypothetical protein